MLTSASVIGDSFSSNLLDNSYKVVVEKHLQTSTLQILREAEDRDLIELIMIDQVNNDMIYRFTNPFMRTALY